MNSTSNKGPSKMNRMLPPGNPKDVEEQMIGFLKARKSNAIQQMDITRLVEKIMSECKHDDGFQLIGFHWWCNRGCGYWINFDPFRFIDGVAYVEDKPEGKRLPPLSTGGKH